MGKMTKIKICGLTRICDIAYVNEGKPDFCGFVVQVPGSRRSVTLDAVRALRSRLHDGIIPVGVFVNAPPETVAELLNDRTIAAAQLHGQEEDSYIAKLRQLTDGKIIQAFSVSAKEDVLRANCSMAEHILLDHGAGGSGRGFDWTLTGFCTRPFFLAGGLTPEGIPGAVREVAPWAVDVSSGVETEGRKDRDKILAAIAAVREIDSSAC